MIWALTIRSVAAGAAAGIVHLGPLRGALLGLAINAVLLANDRIHGVTL